jgi:hypothetical protein
MSVITYVDVPLEADWIYSDKPISVQQIARFI